MMRTSSRSRRRGSALVLGLILLVVVGAAAFVALGTSSASYRGVTEQTRRQRAETVCDTGIELVRCLFSDISRKSTAIGADPFVAYSTYHLKDVFGGKRDILVDTDLDGTADKVGEVAVSAYVLGMNPTLTDNRWVDPQGTCSHVGRFPSVYTTDPTGPAATLPLNRRDIVVFVTAAVPSFDDPRRTVATKEIAYSLQLQPSEVFDFGYFMHNWGWMAGTMSWYFNGSVRSNANFSWLGGCNMNGTPRFDFSETETLSDGNRRDDNGNGNKTDDGGSYAYISVTGNTAAGSPKDTYDNDCVDISADQLHPSQVTLPNINNQAYYDALAGQHVRLYDQTGARLSTVDPSNVGSRVGVYDLADPAHDANGYVWYDQIIGDDEAKQNVVLVGDATHPIIIDGPVVVRGSVMIRGVVAGQGALYCKGNAYVAGNITYKNEPAAPRPTTNSTDDINTWRAANAQKDAFGLFSAENIFFGQGSAPTSYFNATDNDNTEKKSGTDKTNNTGDSGETDGVWTHETYTLDDIAILNPDTNSDGTPGDDPAGPQVGQTVPGSGEDVDADGVEDARSTVGDFKLPGVATAPTSFGTSGAGTFGEQQVLDSQWLGASRLPGWTSTGGGSTYGTVATSAYYLDAVFYSNHFVVGSMAGGNTRLNGAIVGRNECLYASGDFQINHDSRVLGGGSAYNFYLPREWKDPKVLYVHTISGQE